MSRGLGRTIALALARSGFSVLAGVRRREDGEAVRRAASGWLEPLILDFTSGESLRAADDDAERLTAGQVLGGTGFKVGHGFVLRIPVMTLRGIVIALKEKVWSPIMPSNFLEMRFARAATINLTRRPEWRSRSAKPIDPTSPYKYIPG